jgi:hypothetical protein
MSVTTADVARRGPDGWKYVIDNPFGTVYRRGTFFASALTAGPRVS